MYSILYISTIINEPQAQNMPTDLRIYPYTLLVYYYLIYTVYKRLDLHRWKLPSRGLQ